MCTLHQNKANRIYIIHTLTILSVMEQIINELHFLPIFTNYYQMACRYWSIMFDNIHCVYVKCQKMFLYSRYYSAKSDKLLIFFCLINYAFLIFLNHSQSILFTKDKEVFFVPIKGCCSLENGPISEKQTYRS